MDDFTRGMDIQVKTARLQYEKRKEDHGEHERKM